MENRAGHEELADIYASQALTSLLVLVRDFEDKHAFSELFKHFAPRVKSYILRLGSDDTMAEELAQQTLLHVWRKAHLFNEEKAAASTWIFTLARNLRLDLIRKERFFDYDDHDFTSIEDDAETSELLIDRENREKLVHGALSALPEMQLEVVHLSFYEGLSHSEIAERLNLPLGTVKSRIRLAFKRIEESVGDAL